MSKELKKSLNLFDVIAFGLGPMLSSGFFLLPGMVFAKVGPSAILAYFVAGLLVIPSLMSKAELSTAMPKAGGAYYFLDRSMGPLVGTISGFGTWLALAFKSAFALIGLGAYLVFFIDLPVKPVAVSLCALFAVLGISGVKNVGRFQGIFVSIIIGALTFFITKGMFNTQITNFTPLFQDASGHFLEAVGLVYISFAGLTKIASVAEEVEDLDRNIPLGMAVALGVTLIIYLLGLGVVVGVMPGAELAGSITPIADAAGAFMGPIGQTLITLVAIFAFTTAANAGLTAASRYPLAMSRDNLLSKYWKKIGRFNTPTRSIILTAGLMIVFILLLSPESVAKLGSAFKLLVFGMINLAVIVMRESQITAYDPGYKSKLYPWVQIIGILTPVVLIPKLGGLPVISSGGVIIFGALWYYLYAKNRVNRSAAMYQVFERVGAQATPQLYEELRDIIREKGTRREDVFEQCVLRSSVVYHKEGQEYPSVLKDASSIISDRLSLSTDTVFDKLSGMHDISLGSHLALPHAKIAKADHPELVVIHSKTGIDLPHAKEPVYAIFVLVGPADKPKQHLRFLAELAQRAEKIDFAGDWREISDQRLIHSALMRSEDHVEVVYAGPSYRGQTVQNLPISRDCIIAIISRNGSMIVPHGDTELQPNDRLTIIGKKEAVREAAKLFGDE